MAGFRGIGDAAIPVKMQQDQMALQAASAAAARAQQDSQFNKRMEAEKENTAWTRSNTEAVNAENTRRFDVGQQAAGRAEERAVRQLSMEEYRQGLDALKTSAQLGRDTAQTQVANATLQHMLSLRDEEEREKTNRETLAKTALGALVMTGRMNGGVIPKKVLEQANKELGDKDNQIVGGGFDEESGIAFFDFLHLPTGNKVTKRMSPENQYAVIREGIGKTEADKWYETFKENSSQRASIDRQRAIYAEREDYDARKEERRRLADQGDPIKKAKEMEASAKVYSDLAADFSNTSINEDERNEYRLMAADMAKGAMNLRKGMLPQDAKAKPFELTPEIRSKNGIPPNAEFRQDPATGGVIVRWRDKDGKPTGLKFALGEW